MLAFQPLSESSAPQIEKKNLKLSSESKLLKKNIVKSDVPPQDGQTPRVAITIAAASEELSAENTAKLKDLDMQSWNLIFNSLNLSMFVSQVFSEFEFVGFINNTLTLKKSDELINPTEGLKTEFLEAIALQLGQKISLVIENGEVITSPALIDEEMAQNQLNQNKDAFLKNEAVKDILDSFGGKIIDESIKKVSP